MAAFLLVCVALALAACAQGACESADSDSLVFCPHISYKVFLEAGTTQRQMDLRAREVFLAGQAGVGDCCIDVYRQWVCAEMLPRCSKDGAPLPVCEDFVCTAQVEVNVVVQDSCFSCTGMFNATDDCTCPNGSAAGNAKCSNVETHTCLYAAAPCRAAGPLLSAVLLLLVGLLG